jgi:hypothetical protein
MSAHRRTADCSRSVLAAVAVTLILTLGVPGIAGAQVQAQDSVRGTLTQGIGREATTFTIDAFSSPSGQQPGGTVLARNLFLDSDLVVFCLQVTGTRAVIGARQDFPTAVVLYYLIVVDAPGAEQDRLAFQRYGNDPAAPTTCAAADAAGVTPAPAVSGSVVVTDAPAFPTSKAQCRNRGWAQYGFKNQGQCIRFVRLIPGPPPYPSTKAQCRHGGWAQYGFITKRRCLRFVRLRPAP